MHKDQEESLAVIANPSAPEKPEPGSIEHARAALAVQRSQKSAPNRAKGKEEFGREALQLNKVPQMFWPASRFWEHSAFLGTEAMQALMLSARFSFAHLPRDSRINSQTARAFFFKNLASMSDKVLAQFLKLAACTEKGKLATPKVARTSLQGVCALVDSGGLLWGGMLKSWQQFIADGRMQPILAIKASRYDETPLKIRLQIGNGPVSSKSTSKSSEAESSTHAKVMQNEFCLHFLLKDLHASKFLHLQGYVPTWLQVLDSTTAENTKACVLRNYAQVPDLDDFCRLFPWQLQLATVDRYAANLRAERSILHDNVSPAYSKYTKTCDVHVVTQVHLKTISVLDNDVSGMLHTSLAQYGAGVLHSLRSILANILSTELTVIYDAPPQGMVRKHREELHNLFLPIPNAETLDNVSCSTLIRRYILGTMLNGDLEKEEVTHFCPFNCCRDFNDTVSKMTSYVVDALIPGKMPRFVRSRWNQQAESVCWAGLLASHHNLLQKVLSEFTGVPTHGLKPAQAEAPLPAALGWSFLDDDEDPVSVDGKGRGNDSRNTNTTFDAEYGIVELNQDQDVEYEDAFGTDEHGETDWVKRNKAFKKNCGRWAQTAPGPRLVVMKTVMDATSLAVNKAFAVAGSDFDRAQDLACARGQERSYRMLEAAKGEDVKQFFASLATQFENPCPGLPSRAMNSNLLKIHFTMLSRAGCAMEMLLRRPRRGQPYQLFKMLLPDQSSSKYLEDPDCLCDELSAAFRKQFPEWCEDARICLTILAQSIKVDVSQLETRHAISRRLAVMKGLQTWIPSIESLSADWAQKQASLRGQDIYGKVHAYPDAYQMLGVEPLLHFYCQSLSHFYANCYLVLFCLL